ncbi:phosphoribosylformylglycinamidine synthase I [bacterium]|jgi:phosphoribosylformylglycinamidine synthase subunit PurQ / glutaminase|nr:phosphoribosylformylglycinamidine synthase I [bacterium]
MSKPRVLVLRAPGTNCDEETAFAFDQAGGKTDRLHFRRLVEDPSLLDDFQIVCFPGGFSFGDDIAAGRIYSTIIKTKLADAFFSFRDRGGLILGICNGFQILLQTGLLVEPNSTGKIPATLAFNQQGRFEARWVHLKMTAGRCAFVAKNEIITLPIAHAEGRFLVSDPNMIGSLDADHRIVARYVDENGEPGPFPINPNGALGDVAGVCDESGQVFALMPHPERHISPFQHPRWTRRRTQPPEGDGLRLFRTAVGHFGKVLV